MTPFFQTLIRFFLLVIMHCLHPEGAEPESRMHTPVHSFTRKVRRDGSLWLEAEDLAETFAERFHHIRRNLHPGFA
jgi:hypothetical protein